MNRGIKEGLARKLVIEGLESDFIYNIIFIIYLGGVQVVQARVVYPFPTNNVAN